MHNYRRVKRESSKTQGHFATVYRQALSKQPRESLRDKGHIVQPGQMFRHALLLFAQACVVAFAISSVARIVVTKKLANRNILRVRSFVAPRALGAC